jgi:hypothetical protein
MKKFCAYLWIEDDGNRIYKAGVVKNIRAGARKSTEVEILSRHDTLAGAQDARDFALRERYSTNADRVHLRTVSVTAGRWTLENTAYAELVVDWCKRISLLPEPPIPPIIVRDTDNVVPLDFAMAQAQGWLDGQYTLVIRPLEFDACRKFLAYAARSGHEITQLVTER